MSMWNVTDAQASQPKYIKVGQVFGVGVTAGGTGFTQDAAVTFSAAPAGGVTATGTANVTGGVITSVTITNPGAGYVTAPTATAAGGTGATLTPVSRQIEVPNSEIVFVSVEEAALATNRAKGIRTPGWNRVQQYMNSSGEVRYKVEPLVAVSYASATAGDAKGDDLVVGDVDITITAQPATASVVAPTTAAFAVTATGATTYQWQVQTGGVGAYANVAGGTGATTATYTTAATTTDMTGNRYRCLVGNGGTAQVISKGARLAVA